MEKVKPKNTGGSWGLTDDVARLVIEHISPATVLDCGAGVGKYGLMVKNINQNIKVDAIEIFKPTAEWLEVSGIYDKVFNQDILEIKGKYDLGIFGDVLEHIEYDRIFELLRALKSRGVFRFVMIVLPLGFCPQEECGGNQAEVHKSYINEVKFCCDLRDLGYKISKRYVVSAESQNGEYKKMLLTIK